MNLYNQFDYRTVLFDLLNQGKEADYRFTQESLARATGIQKTYLSKILNGVVHPNTDQLFELIDFFKLDDDQSKYLYLLLEYARTAKSRRKKHLKRQIEAIQARHRDTKDRLKADFTEPVNSPQAMLDYYLDPFATLFHISLTRAEFAGDPKAVQRHLGLSDQQVARIQMTLEALKIVERDAKTSHLRVVKDHIHLDGASTIATPYHALFRMASAWQIMKTPADERFTFSVTFSSDEATKTRIHDLFLGFLQSIEPLVRSSDGKETYQLNFDLLPWRY